MADRRHSRPAGAWLTTTARHRPLDILRRRAVEATKLGEVPMSDSTELTDGDGEADFPDERLALIFTCCHPALALHARVALTPRTVVGLLRRDLCVEAIRLARIVVRLLPDDEARGLLALMLLQDARRLARGDERGDLVTLEHQDRALWDRAQIDQALVLLAEPARGPYQVQAAIAAVMARLSQSRRPTGPASPICTRCWAPRRRRRSSSSTGRWRSPWPTDRSPACASSTRSSRPVT